MSAPLPVLLAVDGDWLAYNRGVLPTKACFCRCLENEIAFARGHLQGRIAHLIHVSPLAGLFFLDEVFLPYYRLIVEQGGDIGIHLHMDVPHERYRLFDEQAPLIRAAFARLRAVGLAPVAHRGGYFSYANGLTRLLEDEGVRLDLSDIPGRRMVYEGMVVSDWTGAPARPYRLDYDDYRRPGDSRVWEVPVAADGADYLYLERTDEAAVRRILRRVADAPVAAAVTHTYMFPDIAYSEHFRPCDLNYSQSHALFLLTRELARLCRRLPSLDRLLALKRFSWHALWFGRRLRRNCAAIAAGVRWVNAREALALLEGGGA